MKPCFYLLLVVLAVTGCKKQDSFTLTDIKELYPLQAGKTFFYRLDSTVIAADSKSLLVRSYNAKDSIESTYTDAAGRPAYRIFRYIRDTFNVQPWRYIFTYTAVFDKNHVEFVDNNLRFVTLTNPITEGSQWKGTQYINTSDFGYLKDWNFEYRDAYQPFTVKKGSLQNTYTVYQEDYQTYASLPFDASQYHERRYGKEVYAKGIGLVYKEFLYWQWQPNNPLTVPPYFYQNGSFGIKLSLMDYK
jgi:hypothetical protein